MPRSSKPRKAYRPKHIATDPVERAIAMVAVPPAQSQAALIAPIREALDNLRRGTGQLADWNCLADAHNVALALAELQIANDHRDTLVAGCRALRDLADRVNAGGRYTLRGPELTALWVSTEIHEIQLGLASQREIRDAIVAVQRTVRGVLEGNAPKRAHVVVIGALGTTPETTPC